MLQIFAFNKKLSLLIAQQLKVAMLFLLASAILSPALVDAACIKAADAFSQEIVDNVPTKPEFIDPLDPLSYWTRSAVKIQSQKVQGVSIKALDVDFCSTNSSIHIDVIPSNKTITVEAITFNKGNDVTIRLQPVEQIPLNVHTCKNAQTLGPNVLVVRDYNKCALAAKDPGYAVLKHLSPDSTDLPNLIYPPNVRWVKSPKVTFPKDEDYTSDPPEKMCNAKNTQIWANELINPLCGNVCGVDVVTGRVSNTNCAFTETNEKFVDPDKLASLSAGDTVQVPVYYLPGLSAYLVDTAGSRQALTTETGQVGSGVATNVATEVQLDGAKLVFAFQPGYTNFKGGYKLSVAKHCDRHSTQSLYVFVGESPPGIRPGDPGTTVIDTQDTIARYTVDTSPGGSIYYGVKDNGDGFDNNKGAFEITTRVPIEVKPTFSYVINFVVESVQRVLYGDLQDNLDVQYEANGAVGNIYRAIVNGHLVTLAKAMILLYISIYSIVYLMGLIKTPYVELTIGLIKISVILMLLSPNSWVFFNEHLFSLFINGTGELISAMSGFEGDNNFAFADETIGALARYQTWVQMFSLLFTGPAGWLSLFAIAMGLWAMLMALIEATVLYLISIVLIAILLSISPLFIILILFKKTKAIFDAWIKTLGHFTLQPAVAFAALAMLNQIAMFMFYNILHYDVCTGCVMHFDLEKEGEVLKFCLFSFLLPYGYSPNQTTEGKIVDTFEGGQNFFGLPLTLTNLIVFIIITHSMHKFIKLVPTIITSVFSSMGTELSRPAESTVSSIAGLVGQDQESESRRGQHKSYHKKRGTAETPKSVERKK